mmetsp:Transcript_19082/g.42570  ORF Transcript_19082/g.42570 Transcript_19082/m.42570 type:complete len:328 (+) Transcript_19082:80-1063(+)
MFRFVAALAVLCVLQGLSAFRMHNSPMARRAHSLSTGSSEDFDAKDFDDALKSMGPVYGKKQGALEGEDAEVFNALKKQQEAKAEEIYRVYPYAEIELPTLPDCNNYYSGEQGEYFWHQNADQVYAYLPIDRDVKRHEIKVSFAAKRVEVRIRGEEVAVIDCLERIIPDGSFWVFEEGAKGRYLHLDLEKRYRMINWKSLFGAPIVEDDAQTSDNRAKILEKLFAANKGMSKLSGIPPESMQDLMKNGDLARMMADQIYPEPSLSTLDEFGVEREVEREEGSEAVLEGEEGEEGGGLNLQEMILDAEVVEGAEVVDAEVVEGVEPQQ